MARIYVDPLLLVQFHNITCYRLLYIFKRWNKLSDLSKWRREFCSRENCHV